MQRMMGLVRRCIEDYRMIEPGDRIAVGVSGGKDSLTLLTLLAALREYVPCSYGHHDRHGPRRHGFLAGRTPV